jgi:hypothetical protein
MVISLKKVLPAKFFEVSYRLNPNPNFTSITGRVLPRGDRPVLEL